tara:strand:- start:7411 stop:7641 length:231 start_codon:yes stop_codon:yes gene_type:complete
MKRIFVYNKTLGMKNQYCRVGTTTPLTNEEGMISLLERRYNSFLEMASQIGNTNTKLAEFFQYKAVKIRRTLEKLV